MRNSGIHLYLILPLLLASCSQTMEEFTGSEGYKAIEVVKPVYVPLAPGEIQPLGWLKDQAVLARDGFVGQLDLYDPPYTDAYLDPHDPYVEEAYVDANHFAKTWIAEEIGFRAVGADEDGTGWPLEQAAYWLDGALRLGYLLNDSALINKIEKRLDIVVNGVNDGGDSFIYWLEGQNEDEFNGWAHSHMGRALVAYYHATKKTEVLTALEKVYSRYDPSGPLHQYVTNFCNTDPMLETYRFTGNDSILNNVMNALENRSVDSVINRWAEAKDYFSQHMVVAYENIRLPMLLYPWTGEKKYLDASGLSENTIVIYTSDQGFFLGEHGWFDKRFIYEESFKTPLLVRWPGHIEPGGTSDELVQNLDFAQTLLEAAEIEAPTDMQGESFLPILTGDSGKWTRDAVYYHYYEHPGVANIRRHYGIVTRQYKLVHFYYDIDEWELYDRVNDPSEMNNIYDDPQYTEIVSDLTKELQELRVMYKDSEELDQEFLRILEEEED